MRDVFRDMTLKFTYTCDTTNGCWKLPNLIEWTQQEQDLKAYVRNVRLLIVPSRT